ncbi:hypothetical protein EG68_11271 [Paragonimus skrjabini miyazakii]|uniref:Uncharacterized protein n=1 Tax=Paragonimus skrjabini miyazakii TaxID=59628 RepID=A0A8S9YTE4_9TREM|nr:hypothetical protein EG68_11271 [Paragonimus skrjabini miyazakii]
MARKYGTVEEEQPRNQRQSMLLPIVKSTVQMINNVIS